LAIGAFPASKEAENEDDDEDEDDRGSTLYRAVHIQNPGGDKEGQVR
jgi:hypothetical protein